MQHPSIDQRISGISTNWEQILAAHRTYNGHENVNPAKLEVLRKYLVCVYQYICGATKDHHVAEDLAQDFALRFLRGDFRNVSPAKGRFRDYLKRALRNMVSDHFKSQNRKRELEEHLEPPADSEQLDKDFVAQWRRQLIGYAWESLRDFEKQKSNYYYCVLRARSANPNASSQELAQLISKETGKTCSAEWTRQNLTRARRKFSQFLMDEVRRTLDSPDQDEIDSELASLGLQHYMSEK